MGSGGVAIAALPTVICLKVPFSDGLGGGRILRFILRRLIKFYSSYWVVFCIFVPLGVFVFNRALSIPYGETNYILKPLLLDIFGLQYFSSYNITWWFNRLIISMWITFPLCHKLITSRKVSMLFLPIAIISFPSDILAFIFGIYLATYQHWFNKVTDRFRQIHILAIVSVILVALCVNRQQMFIACLAGLNADPYISLAIVILVPMAIKTTNTRIVILPFLGKHSMNIYMVHTFLYFYFFPDIIYSFRYPGLIFFVLMILSLCISIVLEEIKIRAGCYAFVGRLLDKLSK